MRTAAVLLLVSCAGQTTLRPDVTRIGDTGMQYIAWPEHTSEDSSFANLQLRPEA